MRTGINFDAVAVPTDNNSDGIRLIIVIFAKDANNHLIMKPCILFLLALLALFSSSAQTRSEKEIKHLISKGTVNSPKVIDDDPHMWNTLVNGKEVSLKCEGLTSLRIPLEDSLLVMFDDVLINSKFPKCYFIVKNRAIGVCKLDGTIVVPPVPGVPRKITSVGGLRVGDTSPFSDVVNYFTARVGDKARGAGGSLVALLDDKTLEPLIPYGKYDYIYFTAKGMRSYYYVAKKEGDNYLWGCVDSKGKELVPCEYRAIKLENGKFQGDNSEDMFARINRLKSKIDKYSYNLNHTGEIFFRNLGAALAATGDFIIKLDDTLRESGAYEAVLNMQNTGYITPPIIGSNTTSDYSGNSQGTDASSYQREYNRWATIAERHYNSITNTGSSFTSKKGDKSGSAGQGMASSNYTSMKKSFREAQSQMKSIRQRASKAGVSIAQSKWETATISY